MRMDQCLHFMIVSLRLAYQAVRLSGIPHDGGHYTTFCPIWQPGTVQEMGVSENYRCKTAE